MIKKIIKYNIEKNFPKKNVVFIDFMPTFTNYKIINKVAKEMVKNIKKADYIVSPESRGYIIGFAVSNKLKANLIPLRKHGKIPPNYVGASEEYKTEYSVETMDIPKIDLLNKKCVFIDDVYATGGTYEVSKKLVEKMGGKMVGGYCIYDVGINKNEEIRSLLSKEDIEGEK